MDKYIPPERIITGRFSAEKEKWNLEDGIGRKEKYYIDGDIYKLHAI